MSTDVSALMKITDRPPVVMIEGHGSRLRDEDGKSYLDFVQGWAVNCLGHSPSVIAETVAFQAGRLVNCSPAYYNAEMARLASRLAECSGLDQVFFCNSGAEANEGAIKLARKWGAKHRDGAFEIITMDHGFHGRTLATMAASGKAAWEPLFEPKVPGFVKVPLGDLDAVKAAITPRTVAIMLEPIQGEAGVYPAGNEFLRALRALTAQARILLILDEIQTGIGRTGRWFGYSGTGVVPDLVTLAKGLGGGMPIGACVGLGPAATLLGPGQHGSTYAGNPVACAAGLAVLHAIERDGLLANVSEVGAQLVAGIAGLEHPAVAGVRGEGLLLAIMLTGPYAADVVAAGLDAGFIVNAPAPDAIRMAPPLILSAAQADEFLAALPALLDTAQAAATTDKDA